jgi:DNA-directed RNA polymerase subunit alpha
MPNLGVRSVYEIIGLLKKMGFQSNSAVESDPATILTSAIALEKLNLSTRTYNALKREKIDNLIQLSSLSESELRDIRNFGEKSIVEVREVIKKYAFQH